jgi:hypothetical protein
MSSTCEPSFIKKPLVLVRPATLFPPTACGNDILNAVIRATLLAALIGCAAYYFMYERMSLIMLLSFVIGVLPSIYKVVKSGDETAKPEGFVDSKDFLQFYKPVPNPIMPAEEKGTVSVIPAGSGSPWTLPTPSNPFMNILLTDMKEPDKWKPPVVSAFDPESKQQLDDFFRIQWFSDPTDVFGKNQGQRQFYTMPSNSIPNDRQSYQDWLYKIPGKTCKEGNGVACLPGTDGGAIPWLNKDA